MLQPASDMQVGSVAAGALIQSGMTRESVRALFERVSETCDLPPLPPAAARAMALARDPETRAEELARVVATDPVLAARVLMISRSVRYLRRTPPRTLQEAIVTVGFRALRRILIVASARAAYRGDDRLAQHLWEHSLITAIAADELAIVGREPRGGDAFIAGLLHDIGKLVFHLSDPAAYASVAPGDLAGEQATFSVTHAAVAGCLAELWGLEDDVVEAVIFHHGPAGQSHLGSRIASADWLAYELGYPSQEAAPSPPDPAGAAEVLILADHVRDTFARERELFD